MLEHVEYILKHTPNLTDLFLWGSWHLLDAKKWESLLSTYCPKLLKFKFSYAGYTFWDDDFIEAAHNLRQDFATRRFWIERNVTITFDADYEHILVRLSIQNINH
ncbi:unnamed protein product [Adineta steineri]|uniref:Uncharacterized protein n=1 Tax=Adineta steineri TaxID=433720 RepID=A0A814I300_9BILA|nr:unnamed protein product [Adineta steineri]CAF1267304.1 unnamed protein product [Adineta steineri]